MDDLVISYHTMQPANFTDDDIKKEFKYNPSPSEEEYVSSIEVVEEHKIENDNETAEFKPIIDENGTATYIMMGSSNPNLGEINSTSDVPSTIHYLNNAEYHTEEEKIITLTNLDSQPSHLMFDSQIEEIITETQPLGPTATPVHCQTVEHDFTVDSNSMGDIETYDLMGINLRTLHSLDHTPDIIMDEQVDESMTLISADAQDMIYEEASTTFDNATEMENDCDGGKGGVGKKDWKEESMDAALDALRNHNMSLTKASSTYGIPATTLWQRAHRLGIDTPKKEGPLRSWTEEDLKTALEALRSGTISANKASKAFGIPSSTLYKIARKEGIRLAAPFNATPTSWTQEDLDKALEAIRSGQYSVQKAATEYKIPSGTLYGRCKREKIELSRSTTAPWSPDLMTEALDQVRSGHMSINQASIHYNLPYSSLYGRFRKGKHLDTEQSKTEMNNDRVSSNAEQTTRTTIVQHTQEFNLDNRMQHHHSQQPQHHQQQINQIQHHHHHHQQQQQQQQQQPQQIMIVQYHQLQPNPMYQQVTPR